MSGRYIQEFTKALLGEVRVLFNGVGALWAERCRFHQCVAKSPLLFYVRDTQLRRALDLRRRTAGRSLKENITVLVLPPTQFAIERMDFTPYRRRHAQAGERRAGLDVIDMQAEYFG
jgi:hypothetical protein